MGAFWQTLLMRFLGLAGKLLAQVLRDLNDRGTFERVVELAQLWVARVDGSAGDNAVKRKAAFDGIARDLAAEGGTMRDSAINLALELALSGLRAATK